MALAQAWLSWPIDAQILHLFEAWENAPHNRQERMLRKRLRLRLTQEQPLQPSDQKLLPGLDALGITHQQKLTFLGKAVLGLAAFPSPAPREPWWLEGQALHIPHNPDWSLLWQLESYLIPRTPFTYSLDAPSLRQSAQRGAAETLIGILEKGLGAPPPPEIRARILGQPTLKVSTGLVLEFSNPAELRQLRRSEPLRTHFERILSPRHILVDEKTAPRLLNLLERRGIYASSPLPPGEGPGVREERADGSGEGRTHFSRAGLLEPLGESIPLLQFLQQSIQLQLAFDMLYNAPNAERPEIHRITPVLIEERGGYTYVIAYTVLAHGASARTLAKASALIVWIAWRCREPRAHKNGSGIIIVSNDTGDSHEQRTRRLIL